MDPVVEPPSIAAAARACVIEFDRALGLASWLPPRENASVEDQIARFSLWSANTGVFAQGKLSMDYRLREVPEIHSVVTGLLDALLDQIIRCISFSVILMDM